MIEAENSSDECCSEQDDGDVSSKQEKGMTWAEAAAKVLAKFNHPLPHKDILKHIQEANLKDIGRGNSAPLAVLNSMLNTHSRGPGAIFYKDPSGSACFGLAKNQKKSENVDDVPPTSARLQNNNVSTNSPITIDSMTSTKTYTEFKKDQKEKESVKYNPPRSLKLPGELNKSTAQRQPLKKKLIPPGGSSYDFMRRNSPTLGNLSQEAYDRLKQHPQHRRMGPTTSALVRPSPPFSRPPPGAALRVMPPKKRVKLEEDEDVPPKTENTTTLSRVNYVTKKLQSRRSHYKSDKPLKKSPKVELRLQRRSVDISQRTSKHEPTVRRELVRHQKTISKPLNTHTQILPKKKISFKPLPRATQMNQRSRAPQIHTKPPLKKRENPVTVDTNDKQPAFLGVKFKRMKKANLADQIKRSKEGKLDLMTPDSILTSIHFKDCINEHTFTSLPPAYQYQLLMLLPDVDRQVSTDGALRLSPHALNNEFFTRACQEYKDKLMDGEFNSDILQRARNEVQSKLDPWKVKFFEPVYGSSTLEDSKENTEIEDERPPDLQPVKSSWVTFLKFAEDSTDDFAEALQKIQVQVKKVAQKEAEEKEKLEKLKQEELSNDSTKNPPARHSLMTLKSKSVSRPEDYMKCQRALKRAYQLQRKKVFDKQLKDAKAKIVEDARCGSRKEDNTIEPTNNTNKLSTARLLAKSGITTSYAGSHNSPLSNVDASETQSKNSVLDLSDNNVLKRLIKQNDDCPKLTVNKSKNSRRKFVQGSFKSESTRILHGPASFGTNEEGKCACNLHAMVVCKKCGTFWHGDGADSEKNCILCAT